VVADSAHDEPNQEGPASRDWQPDDMSHDTGGELAERNGHAPTLVDPEEEPSAAWGWHGGFPRGSVIAGWISVASLIAMNFTNNNGDGYVANIYLSCIAAGMAVLLVRHSRRKRHFWRR
jgi:hypothetical protein